MIDHINLELLKKSSDEIIFNEKHTFFDEDLKKSATLVRDYAVQHSLKIAKLIDDFIYKNLDTNVLETMKCKIENELLKRRLKESEE